MEDFRDKLKKISDQASQEHQRKVDEKRAEEDRAIDQANRVDNAAKMLEAHIELRLHEFNQQFIEFRYKTWVDNGRRFRLYWDEPGSRTNPKQKLHQLQLRVRRYREYADVEVEVKMIIANAEKQRRAREEDVYEGDPEKLKQFIDEQIFAFTQLYVKGRGW